MAFDILINTKDSFIYSLVEWNLMRIFPDAYIHMTSDASANSLSSFAVYIYDNSCPADSPSINKIELFTSFNGHLIVDCDELARRIQMLKDNQQEEDSLETSSTTNPKTTLLVPFVYPDDRESFISNNLSSLITADCMCIRLDCLCNSYLASSDYSGLSSGAMTALLNKAEKGILPNEILEYLNPDNQGFLSAGPTDHPDDFYDASEQAITNLLLSVNQLLINEKGNFDCLIVADGYRTKDLFKYIPYAKKLHILLPDKKLINHEHMQELIKTLSKKLSPASTLSIHYVTE